MIKPTSYYEVICDHCGERLDVDGVTAWETEDDAVDAANYAGWQQMESERVYCDNCLDSGEIMFGEPNNEDDYE
nr:MAG TPA: hypothetical protein [Caudoviricetes sp.]